MTPARDLALAADYAEACATARRTWAAMARRNALAPAISADQVAGFKRMAVLADQEADALFAEAADNRAHAARLQETP